MLDRLMRKAARGPSEEFVRRRVPPWFKLEVARGIQRLLASRVIEEDLVDVDKVELICGLDVAYVQWGDKDVGIGVAALTNIKGSLIEWRCWVGEVVFPYVPTLLSFRELKPIVNAFMRLSKRPQVALIDGHGKAHPYRLGIASHFGVCMRIPAIGVAKSLLYGVVEGVCDVPIRDPDTGEVIGWAVCCVPGKPSYVSVGYGVKLESAIRLVKALCRGSQMPIPILHAHNLANRLKRQVKELLERHGSLDKVDQSLCGSTLNVNT